MYCPLTSHTRGHDVTTVFGLAALNEEMSIDPLFTRIAEFERLHGPTAILFYNDGSIDDTGERVQAWQDRLDIRYMGDSENRGLAFGVARIVDAFVEEFKPQDCLVLMDCDDTHDPAQAAQMLTLANKKTVVVASRYQKGSVIQGLSMFRRIASRIFSTLAMVYFRLPGVRDYTSGFRLYPHEVLESVHARGMWPRTREFGFAVTPDLLIRCGAVGASITEIPMILSYDRKASASSMRVARNARNLLRLLPTWRKMIKTGHLSDHAQSARAGDI